jgi:hypothetical protein
VGLACFIFACGGDGGSTGDAGPDATQSDATQSDVATNDGGGDAQTGCPSYSGSSTICQALVARCNACGGAADASQCALANFAAICEATVGAVYSQAAGNAELACANVCAQPDAQACASAALADAALTNAQLKSASDYCAACLDAGPGCADMVGHAFLVPFSDSLSNAIDTKCTPDAASGCGQPWLTCAQGLLKAGSTTNICDAGAD